MNFYTLFFTRVITPLIIISSLIYAGTTQAHNSGLSFAQLRVEDSRISATLIYSQADISALVILDKNGDGSVSLLEWAQARPNLNALAADLLILSSDDQPLTVITEADVELDQGDGIRFELSFQRPAGSKLQVKSPLLSRLASGHRQFLSIMGQHEQRHRDILSATRATAELELSPEKLH